MAKFRKRPVEIEATQWFKSGDHDQVLSYEPLLPNVICGQCGERNHSHGWVSTLEGGHIVCPGDWIITGVKGEHYPCKPDIFPSIYESV